jgi:hypothetical protein
VILKGLIIDEPWVSMIMAGEKTREMRSRNTAVRGRIALIRKGSKTVVGVPELVGTRPKLSRSKLTANVDRHQGPANEIDDHFKYDTAWVMKGARPLPQPVPCRHPVGAVIWGNIDDDVAGKVEQ